MPLAPSCGQKLQFHYFRHCRGRYSRQGFFIFSGSSTRLHRESLLSIPSLCVSLTVLLHAPRGFLEGPTTCSQRRRSTGSFTTWWTRLHTIKNEKVCQTETTATASHAISVLNAATPPPCQYMAPHHELVIAGKSVLPVLSSVGLLTLLGIYDCVS